MTILLCTGSLSPISSEILKTGILKPSRRLPVYQQLIAQCRDICQHHAPRENELSWVPFTPGADYLEPVHELLSSLDSASVFAWTDNNCSLFLDYWKACSEDIRFVLFYSRPEHELSQYIQYEGYDSSVMESVIESWRVRTRAMLTFYMNNRDRCILVNERSIAASYDSLIQALNDRFEVELPRKSKEPQTHFVISPLIEFFAATLLLNRHEISDIFDEVRSVATLIGDEDTSIGAVEKRIESLKEHFLDEVERFEQLTDRHTRLEDDLGICTLQIDQLTEELEQYFKAASELENEATVMADYLENDPLLKMARHARRMQ
jgi:hypothetical protein